MSDISQHQKNLLIVLERLKLEIIQDEYLTDDLITVLEPLLDEWAMDDGFGTEGQYDPRGDFRNGEWSLWTKVSGA